MVIKAQTWDMETQVQDTTLNQSEQGLASPLSSALFWALGLIFLTRNSILDPKTFADESFFLNLEHFRKKFWFQ